MRIYVILGFWKLFYHNTSVVISWFTLYLVHYSKLMSVFKTYQTALLLYHDVDILLMYQQSTLKYSCCIDFSVFG